MVIVQERIHLGVGLRLVQLQAGKPKLCILPLQKDIILYLGSVRRLANLIQGSDFEQYSHNHNKMVHVMTCYELFP